MYFEVQFVFNYCFQFRVFYFRNKIQARDIVPGVNQVAGRRSINFSIYKFSVYIDPEAPA